MKKLGYGTIYHERTDGNCAQGVFYNQKKLRLIKSEKIVFTPDVPELPHFFISCLFADSKDEKKQFRWI